MAPLHSLFRIAREIYFATLDAITRDAYARYLAHRQAHHPDEPVLSRRDFYLRTQERKWSRVNRCC
jgi:uncharacterized short protein YbdD (DUF466 family)